MCWERKNDPIYDGEVSIGYEATMQLPASGMALAKVVFFIDSLAAISSLSTIQCRAKIAELVSYGWTVALRWVPSHVGIPGKQRTLYPHTLTKNQEPWKAIGNLGHCRSYPEAPGENRGCVARFYLTTGLYFLGVYLQWLGLAAAEACPLCGHARMDGDHLLQ
ncbi:reverse transcriptase [Trichonephila clavipes]|nr:reverse transcriptase [Trichonephila clavipes]